MSALCFPLDEHVPLIIQAQLEQMEPGMRIYAIGDGIAPLKAHWINEEAWMGISAQESPCLRIVIPRPQKL